MTHLDARPLLFVVSGPSGAGKGTALRHLTDALGLRRVPTCTTRPARPGEEAGRDYRFLTEPEFAALQDSGEIFESTRTYADSLYGSPRDLLDAGDPEPLLTELDPGGFVRVRAASQRRVVGLFVTAGSEDELRRRITLRGQGDEADRRLKIRTDQLTWAWMYDYVLLNDDRDGFLRDVATVVTAELVRLDGARRMLAAKAHAGPRA